MARASARQKEETHRRIVEQASRRFRRDGLAAVGLRTLMTDAGMTHGGFYAHFKSREDLIHEAIARAFEETRHRLASAVAKHGTEPPHQAFIRTYLDPQHVTRPEIGCAGASLAAEVPREGGAIQKTFANGLSDIVEILERALPPGGSAGDRAERAWAVFAMLLGGIQLARSMADSNKSAESLETIAHSASLLCELPWG